MGGTCSAKVKDKEVQQIQEDVKAFWDLKRSVEDQTKRVLKCVDILESASEHILHPDEKSYGHQDEQVTLETQTRKQLLSMVLEEKEEKRQSFKDEIIKFVEFVSTRVSRLQTDHGHGNVECEIQGKREAESINRESIPGDESEDKAIAGDRLKKIYEGLRKKIDQRDKENESLKKEINTLRELNNILTVEREKDVDNTMNVLQRSITIEKQNDLLKREFDSCKFKIISLKSLVQMADSKQMPKSLDLHARKTAEYDEVREGLTVNEENERQLIENKMSKFSTLETKVKENEDNVPSLTTLCETNKHDHEHLKAFMPTKMKEHEEVTDKYYNEKLELNCQLDELKETLEKGLEEKKYMDTVLKQLKEDLKKCESAKCKTENELHKLREDVLDKKKECDRLKELLNKAREQLRKQQEQYDSLKSNYRSMDVDYSNKVKHLESKVRYVESNEMKLKKDLEMCHSENTTLLVQLNDLNSKRIVKMKLFAIRRPNTLADFEDALIAMLKTRIDDDVKELIFEQNDNPDVVNTDTDPTIVLSFCGSNITIEAKNAVKGLTLSPKLALVLIHYKDVYALPTQLSERVVTEPEYKKLHFITDMAFLSDKGIYPCEINNNSVAKLVNFIKTECKEYKKY